MSAPNSHLLSSLFLYTFEFEYCQDQYSAPNPILSSLNSLRLIKSKSSPVKKWVYLFVPLFRVGRLLDVILIKFVSFEWWLWTLDYISFGMTNSRVVSFAARTSQSNNG